MLTRFHKEERKGNNRATTICKLYVDNRLINSKKNEKETWKSPHANFDGK